MVLFALGTALAIFATRQEPDAEILGPDRQVEIHGDPVVQREFDAGWEALLEADFDRAVRRLGVVVAREPDHPLPWLVYWYALLQADRRAESLSAFWAAVERAEDRRGASAKLTQALANVRRHGWSGAEQEVQDHLVLHPEDFFARVAAFAVVTMTEELQAQALLAEARTIEPQPALLAYLEGSRALVQEDFRQAERVVQEGLATHPRSPTLLALQGEVLLKRGAFERARDALTDALNEDPGMHIARTRLSGAHLMLDDREAADAITEQMMEPTTRWDHQVRYATSVSEILIGLGRYHEATALLHRAEAIAAEHNAWLSVITLRGAEALYHLAGDDTESMSAATQKLIDISHNPEIPDAERENLVRNLLYAQGMATARRGEIEDALRILGRLRQLDRVWPQYLEYLEREIAVARRDVDAIAGLMSSIPETCVGDLERGHYLWLAGRPDLAAPWIRPRLAAPEDCSAVGETRLRFADSHLILSELALQEGDTETAETHLQAFEALWPTPDADLPITRRHAALRTEGIDLTP